MAVADVVRVTEEGWVHLLADDGAHVADAIGAAMTAAPDTTLPTIVAFTITPRPGRKYAIHVAATDPVGIALIRIRVNGTIRKSVANSETCDLTTRLDAGPNSIRAEVIDRAGNVSTRLQTVP